MKVVKKIIVANLQVEGLHKWQDAYVKCPDSFFLEHPHRHMFHIQAEKEVSHSDRDVEFIVLKRSMAQYIKDNFMQRGLSSGDYITDFGNMSCEMIAETLAHEFGLSKCIVLEDGENGGGVICE